MLSKGGIAITDNSTKVPYAYIEDKWVTYDDVQSFENKVFVMFDMVFLEKTRLWEYTMATMFTTSRCSYYSILLSHVILFNVDR